MEARQVERGQGSGAAAHLPRDNGGGVAVGRGIDAARHTGHDREDQRSARLHAREKLAGRTRVGIEAQRREGGAVAGAVPASGKEALTDGKAAQQERCLTMAESTEGKRRTYVLPLWFHEQSL